MNQKSVDVPPPVAPRKTRSFTIHGETLHDEYDWLREKDSPEVLNYLEAENSYTEAKTAHLTELRERLFKEISGRIKQTDISVPYRNGRYFYYSRTEEGKQQRVYCRRLGSLDAPEEILLDLNTIAPDASFVEMDSFEISPDGRLLAYTLDTTGFREFTLYIKHLDTGALDDAQFEKVKSVAWAADSRTLFFTLDDAAKRSYQVYRHRLGEAGKELILEETDQRFSLYLRSTRSRKYILLHSESMTTTEYHYIPADAPESAPTLFAARQQDIEYYVYHSGEHFYVLSNDRGRNFRLTRCAESDPRGPLEELIPHSEEIKLDGADAFANHLVLWEWEGGGHHIRVLNLSSGDSHRITFPEEVYSIWDNRNEEFFTSKYRFTYQSPVTPGSVFDYDMNTRERELLKQDEVVGGFDAEKYATRLIYAKGLDGTRIPISLAYRKELLLDGSRPLFMVGYGAYSFSTEPYFSHARLSLLERGVIFAIAHVRGGGEMGKKWHDQGRMEHKMNTFTDFIRCAETLIEEGYTRSDRLVVSGGSAGGLLMGAIANMRPELFSVVLSHVPFVDVINTMLDEDAPLTVGEFEEWGNPKIKEEYEVIRQYCPYTNLEAQAYPTMLVSTSYNDSQVMYWEPAKYVARLRTLKTDDNLLLFKINMAGGHGGYSGRFDQWQDIAFDYAFMLNQLGVEG